MLNCQVCRVNELIEDDEIETGMCRDCQSSMLADDDRIFST